MRPAKRKTTREREKTEKRGEDAIKGGHKANNEGGVKGMMASKRVEIKVCKPIIHTFFLIIITLFFFNHPPQ